MSRRDFRYVVVEADRAGTTYDLLYSSDPIVAFRFAESQRTGHNFVGVNDADDGERGWLDEDAEIERWLDSLGDADFFAAIERHTAIRFPDGHDDPTGERTALLRDTATDELYACLYGRAA